LALVETVEIGKPIANTLAVDGPGCAAAVAYYAEAADKLYDEIAPTGPKDQALIKRMPLGVVGVVTPWNYPLIIAGWKITPALLMGNSVVLKPAEHSSLGSLVLGRLAKEAGIPDGVFNVVPGYGTEAGQALAAHMDVDMLAFTGSTATGKHIMATAANSNLKRVALELGGKSPQIVLKDCPDLDAAASAIAWSIFYNAGQTCHAGSRLIVDKAIAADLYTRIAAVAATITPGHPLDPNTGFGALADAKQLDRVASYLELAKAEGARFVMGGATEAVVPGGAYVQPTLITDVAPSSRLAQEEIFGPVLVAFEVDGADEALALAQESDYGLAASVWTSDMGSAHRFSEALAAGTVWINTYDQASMATPFGGFKQSGFGRDRSLHAIEKYCDLKTVWTHFP
jgi:gamma-glutamyl-gamma-aminobutyraldehyde dehydrogenase